MTEWVTIAVVTCRDRDDSDTPDELLDRIRRIVGLAGYALAADYIERDVGSNADRRP